MEGIRLTGRLALLVLLMSSGTISAVEVFPEQRTQVSVQQAQPAAQASRLKRLRAMVGRQPATSVATVELTAEDQQQIEQHNETAAAGRPLKVGLVKPVGIEVDLKPLDVPAMTEQTYSYLGGMVRRSAGRLAWAMRLDAVGSGGVRLRFDDVRLPDGAQIHIYNEAGDVRGPYEGKAGTFWTHTIDGEQIYVQVDQTEQAPEGDVRFRIGAMLLLDAASQLFCPNNAACVEDGSCYGANEWSEIDKARKAIAHINFINEESGFVCTGGLLADRDETTSIPYFLTANHCIDNAGLAATMEAWFDYRTSACRDQCPDRPFRSSTLGATLLRHSAVEDYSLLMLDEEPPADAWYLGWTDSPVANASGTVLYRLSHPRGSPQAFSLHQVDTTISPGGFCGTTSMPRGPFIFSRNLIGATEGGSSGAPVMQANGQVVGQLFGICGFNILDVCDADKNRILDGAFASYFDEVAKWLDPDPARLPLTVHKFGSGQGRVMSAVGEDGSDSPSVAAQGSGGLAPMLLGGEEVESSDWPWQAALKISTWQVNGEWSCGGSVIDSNWVLTSARCVTDTISDPYGRRFYTVAPANIQVRTGSNRVDYGGQVSGVKRIVRHPFYDPSNRDNDLALLELKSPTFVEPVRPVTLEREQTLACLGTAGVVTGWSSTDACGYPATLLTKVDVTVEDVSVCRDAYRSDFVTNNSACTTTDASESSLCQEDDGSPMVVGNGRGGYVQAGIVSRGNGCGSQRPTVHMRVANYVDWMESVTGLDLSSDVGAGVIDCGSTCAAEYPSETLVKLTATAASGSTFAGWGGACSGIEASCEVTMNQALRVMATFNSSRASSQASRQAGGFSCAGTGL